MRDHFGFWQKSEKKEKSESEMEKVQIKRKEVAGIATEVIEKKVK